MQLCYKTCLLIDDNYIDNFVTRRILQSGNFAEHIVVKESASDAIESIRTGKIKPDVIFLDLRMPQMDGFEFLQEYARLNLDEGDQPKIFMLSSSLDPVDFRRSTENKLITQFVHKPLTQQTLEQLCL